MLVALDQQAIHRPLIDKDKIDADLTQNVLLCKGQTVGNKLQLARNNINKIAAKVRIFEDT